MAAYQVEGGFVLFTPYEELATDLLIATDQRQHSVTVRTHDLRVHLSLYDDLVDYVRMSASNDAYANELLKRAEPRNV